MDLISRKTRFKNRTHRAISIQPFRSSLEHGIEIEGREIVIAAKKQLRVKSNEFSYEETVPEFHGMLVVRFVGEEKDPATITARHVKLSADILFDEDHKHRLCVNAIPEQFLDYIPFGRMVMNQERIEVPIFTQPEQTTSTATDGAANMAEDQTRKADR